MPASITRTLALTLGLALSALSAVVTNVNDMNIVSVSGAQLIPSCIATYTIVENDTCNDILLKHPNTLTLDQFMRWNPTIHRDCRNLVPGEVVCIRARMMKDCADCSTSSTMTMN